MFFQLFYDNVILDGSGAMLGWILQKMWVKYWCDTLFPFDMLMLKR